MKGHGVTEDGGAPIAYSALQKGVPVISRSGHQFGTLERVLEVPEADIFHGIVVATADGLRFVDRDHVERITTSQINCALSDEQAAELPDASAEDPDQGPWRPKKSWFAPWALAGPVVIVRCMRGSLFETVWIPLVSRFGWVRFESSGARYTAGWRSSSRSTRRRCPMRNAQRQLATRLNPFRKHPATTAGGAVSEDRRQEASVVFCRPSSVQIPEGPAEHLVTAHRRLWSSRSRIPIRRSPSGSSSSSS